MTTAELVFRWPPGRHLLPELFLNTPHSLPTIEFAPDLARAYRCFDGTLDDPLMPEQRRSADLLLASWQEIERELSTLYPSATSLEWDDVRISNRTLGDLAYAHVRGLYDGPDEHLQEHATEVILLGTEVVASGIRGVSFLEPPGVVKPARPDVRPHPDYKALTTATVVELLERGLWGDLVSLRRHHPDGAQIPRTLMEWLASKPVFEALAAVESAGPLVGESSEPPPWDWVQDRPELTKALLAAGRFSLPRDLLHSETDPERLRGWLMMGAQLERTVRRDLHESGQTALQWHVDRPAMFVELLALGADPQVLRDGYGGLRYPLGPEQLAALERYHPGFLPAESEAQAGTSVLAEWQARGWIELSDGANAAAIQQALEALLQTDVESGTLLDALLESPGVEDVFVSEDEVDGFRAAW